MMILKLIEGKIERVKCFVAIMKGAKLRALRNDGHNFSNKIIWWLTSFLGTRDDFGLMHRVAFLQISLIQTFASGDLVIVYPTKREFGWIFDMNIFVFEMWKIRKPSE